MFFYPFSYRQHNLEDFASSLRQNSYTFYKIDDVENEGKYYGGVARVSHKK